MFLSFQTPGECGIRGVKALDADRVVEIRPWSSDFPHTDELTVLTYIGSDGDEYTQRVYAAYQATIDAINEAKSPR